MQITNIREKIIRHDGNLKKKSRQNNADEKVEINEKTQQWRANCILTKENICEGQNVINVIDWQVAAPGWRENRIEIVEDACALPVFAVITAVVVFIRK